MTIDISYQKSELQGQPKGQRQILMEGMLRHNFFTDGTKF
jgi:hypothetical protein